MHAEQSHTNWLLLTLPMKMFRCHCSNSCTILHWFYAAIYSHLHTQVRARCSNFFSLDLLARLGVLFLVFSLRLFQFVFNVSCGSFLTCVLLIIWIFWRCSTECVHTMWLEWGTFIYTHCFSVIHFRWWVVNICGVICVCVCVWCSKDPVHVMTRKCATPKYCAHPLDFMCCHCV